MSGDPYSPVVRELFAAPAHVGDVEDGVTASVDDQGIRLQLSARVTGAGIEAMRFRAWGCPHLIAAAEWLCGYYEGRQISALEDFPRAPIMEHLAIPMEKTGRILVLEDTVRLLGQKFGDGS
ncbi:MAG: iron-sulfur cluster assembly scaffold protein [Woeseiaceae bacterium]|nr:iron-sulfur cluster assembly scaffold protein [Woeseiaceae bacterium]